MSDGISHTQARDLAKHFLGNDTPALAEFHSTGAISEDLGPELMILAGRQRGIEIRGLLELSSYVLKFGERVAVPSWQELNGHRILRARLLVELPVPEETDPPTAVQRLIQRIAEMAIVADVQLEPEA